MCVFLLKWSLFHPPHRSRQATLKLWRCVKSQRDLGQKLLHVHRKYLSKPNLPDSHLPLGSPFYFHIVLAHVLHMNLFGYCRVLHSQWDAKPNSPPTKVPCVFPRFLETAKRNRCQYLGLKWRRNARNWKCPNVKCQKRRRRWKSVDEPLSRWAFPSVGNQYSKDWNI